MSREPTVARTTGPDRSSGSDHHHRTDLHILLVCTANQCRSPMAEFLLRRALADRGMTWSVASAGTHARPGSPMHPQALRLLRSRGIETGNWGAQITDDRLLDSAELILPVTRQHRSILLSRRPDVASRSFPLLQFTAAAEAARRAGQWTPRPDRPAGLLTAVLAVQGQLQPREITSLDLADPVGRSYHRFRRCARTIDEAISQLLGA